MSFMVWRNQGTPTRPDHPVLRLHLRQGPARALLVAAVVGAGLAAGGAAAAAAAAPHAMASKANPPTRSKVILSTKKIPGVGTVLVNRSGHTIYFNTEETSGKILCTSSCLEFWIPVTAPSGVVPRATVKLPGTLSTIRRPGTSEAQVVYKGKPLYTFRLDTSAGQAKGNGFTDHFGPKTFHWRAAITTHAAAATKATPTTSSGYNYNYP